MRDEHPLKDLAELENKRYKPVNAFGMTFDEAQAAKDHLGRIWQSTDETLFPEWDRAIQKIMKKL